MTKHPPLITIGITCYNAVDTISRAINGARLQDWPNTEIIIVDDASKDNSAQIIDNIIKDLPQARLIIHEKNKAFPGALNTIIKEAKGDFIAIFDDDDQSSPTRLSVQYKRIVEYEQRYNAALVVCHSARIQEFPNGYTRYECTMGTNKEQEAPSGIDVADRILIGRLSPDVVGSCANCSRMARTSLFRKMHGYDESMRRGEDTDFNVRLAMAGGHFVGIAEPLVNQKMIMKQRKNLDQEYKAELIILDKNREYLENIGWYNFCKSWLDIRFSNLNGDRLAFCKKITMLALKSPIKCLKKFIWAIPAYKTRRAFKKWHHVELNG